MAFKTQNDRVTERNDAIIATLRSVPGGMTVRELSEELAANYYTVRSSVVHLTNLGRITQTSEYRNGIVYKSVDSGVMPTLFLQSKSISLVDYLRSTKGKNNILFAASLRVPYTLASLVRLAVPRDDIVSGQSTEKDRAQLRRDLVQYRDLLYEIVQNIDIVLNADSLWDTDRMLRKVFAKVSNKQAADVYEPHSEFRRTMADALTGSSQD